MQLSYEFKISMIILFFVFLSHCAVVINSSIICEGLLDALPKDRLGTKTGYFNFQKDQSFWLDYVQQSASCTPLHVWFLTRHGTRYPIGDDYNAFKHLPQLSESILYNHLQGMGCLSENEVFDFKQWFAPYELRDKGQLHETGAEELYEMGHHWKNLFPSVFTDPYNSKNIKIEFTTRNRTGQSAYHFIRGMYGDDEVGKIQFPLPYTPNFLLRFYKSCPRWLTEVYHNNNTYYEQTLFEKTHEFQSVLHSVSERLGFTFPIEITDLLAMYNECRYEASWWPEKRSIWCIPFSESDIEVLEYHQDLKYYYEDTYGTPMNERMACKTISDLQNKFKNMIDNNMTEPRSVLYFSHDKTLLHVHNTLGLFKPIDALRHDNFQSQKNRIFRTSRVAPFATNLGFVLFRCDEGTYKVALFFQGNPLPLPSESCPNLLCEWEAFNKAFLLPYTQDCDLSKICMIHDEL